MSLVGKQESELLLIFNWGAKLDLLGVVPFFFFLMESGVVPIDYNSW